MLEKGGKEEEGREELMRFVVEMKEERWKREEEGKRDKRGKEEGGRREEEGLKRRRLCVVFELKFL